MYYIKRTTGTGTFDDPLRERYFIGRKRYSWDAKDAKGWIRKSSAERRAAVLRKYWDGEITVEQETI